MSERWKWLRDAGVVVLALALLTVSLLFAGVSAHYQHGYEDALDQCPQEDSCDYIGGRWVPVEH